MGTITDIQKVREQNNYCEVAMWHLKQAKDMLNALADNLGTLSPAMQYQSALAIWGTIRLVKKTIEEQQAAAGE